MDSLPNFLTHGAPLCARFARARSSAIIIINYYYIISFCSITAFHFNGHPLSITSNRDSSNAITVKSKERIYHTINCTAIINIIKLLKVQFPAICYLSIEPELVLHHWIPKILVQFSYLTLYLGTETVSMQWMDMDWNLKTVSPTFSSLIICLKKSPPPPHKKNIYIYYYG